MTTQDLDNVRSRHQRAFGQVAISSKPGPEQSTVLKDLRQAGSLKAVFPRNRGGRMEAVLVNTAGGVTGGDRFDISLRATGQSCLTLTTQAAERIYRATRESTGRIRSRLTVDPGAQLNWLPQETILFDGCRLKRQLEVSVAETGRFLMLEPLVFGREASGEDLQSAWIDDCVTISSQGHPLYRDQVRLNGPVSTTLGRPAIANGARAMANLVLVGDDAEAMLPAVRDLLPKAGGASLLASRVLVARLLCPDSYALRKTLLPILTLVTRSALPKNWSL